MAKVSSKNMFYVLGSILIIILIVMTLNSRGKKQTSGRISPAPIFIGPSYTPDPIIVVRGGRHGGGGHGGGGGWGGGGYGGGGHGGAGGGGGGGAGHGGAGGGAGGAGAGGAGAGGADKDLVPESQGGGSGGGYPKDPYPSEEPVEKIPEIPIPPIVIPEEIPKIPLPPIIEPLTSLYSVNPSNSTYSPCNKKLSAGDF